MLSKSHMYPVELPLPAGWYDKNKINNDKKFNFTISPQQKKLLEDEVKSGQEWLKKNGLNSTADKISDKQKEIEDKIQSLNLLKSALQGDPSRKQEDLENYKKRFYELVAYPQKK